MKLAFACLRNTPNSAQVISDIETSSPVELIAIGVGHDVTRYYRRAVTIIDVEQLGGVIVEKLAELFDEEPRKAGRLSLNLLPPAKPGAATVGTRRAGR